MSHEVVRYGDRDVLVVAFAGTIPPGSEGNEDAGIGTDYIEAHLSGDHAALVVDLTDLDYTWGNFVGGWCVAPAKRWGIPVRFVAAGQTAKALLGLLETSGLEVILGEPMIQPTVAAALDSLP